MNSKNPIEEKQSARNQPNAAPAMSWDAIDQGSWEAVPANAQAKAWAGKQQQAEEDEEEEEQRAETD